jgi:hypothetical protein
MAMASAQKYRASLLPWIVAFKAVKATLLAGLGKEEFT